jgi:hypothetical protein
LKRWAARDRHWWCKKTGSLRALHSFLSLVLRQQRAVFGRTNASGVPGEQRSIFVSIAIHGELRYAVFMIVAVLHFLLSFLVIDIVMSMIAIDDMRGHVMVKESRYNLDTDNTNEE